MPLTLVALMLAWAARTTGASMLRKSITVPKPEPTIPNPAKNSVSDVIPNDPAAKPAGQKYNHEYVPQSSPAVPDRSPTDPAEWTEGWSGAVANIIDDMDDSEGMRFVGATCKSTCAACTIWSAQNSGCACYSTCKMGECGDEVLPHIGWSNNEVSSPRSTWRANCNTGTKNCEAQCMDDSLKEEIKKCGESLSPADCYRRLSENAQPDRHDSRKNVHWCVREGMTLCDEFLYTAPGPFLTPGSKDSDGWICYDEQDKCQQYAEVGFKIPLQRWTPPPVWTAPDI